MGRALFEPMREGAERWLWPACIILGVTAALPYLLCAYLPLTDFPMHQLTLATWAQPERFSEYYERQSYWLPYWTPLFIARPFVGLLGVEAASRVPVFLYVAMLPATSALLARAAGRSGAWGLLLAAFALEFNLSWGFVAYCLGGALLQIVIACALFAERSPRPARIFVAQGAVAFVLGFTHPQVAAAAAAACGLIALLGSTRRLAIVAASLPALIPSLVYFSNAEQATAFDASGIRFAAPGEMLARLGEFSVGVFDGPLAPALLACAVGLAMLSWWRAPRPSLASLRVPIVGVAFLAGFFVTPFEWNGQAIAERMPFLALLCLPAMAAPGRKPGLIAAVLIGAIAVTGAANAAMVIRAFDADTAVELDPLIADAPEGARTAYATYDASWSGIRSLPYLHTGALLTLRKGGVYAFHFNRLNTRYRDAVPLDQTFIKRNFAFSRRFARKGEIVTVSRADIAFWNTLLVRFPVDDKPLNPVRGLAPLSFEHGRRFGLLTLP